MDLYEEDRQSLEKALRYAFDNGQLVMKCDDRARALALRANFYTYFRWLERQSKYKRKPELANVAKELLAMRKELNIGAHKSGELILKRKAEGMSVRGIVEDALNNGSRPSERDIMDELREAEAEMLMERVRKPKKKESIWGEEDGGSKKLF